MSLYLLGSLPLPSPPSLSHLLQFACCTCEWSGAGPVHASRLELQDMDGEVADGAWREELASFVGFFFFFLGGWGGREWKGDVFINGSD